MITLITQVAGHFVEWAEQITAEWTWLFSRHNLIEIHGHTFTETVLNSEEFWVILFLDTIECSSCKTAKTNMMRLSAGLRGLAEVGYIDCEQPTNRDLCVRVGMPQPPFSPQVLAFHEGNPEHPSNPVVTLIT